MSFIRMFAAAAAIGLSTVAAALAAGGLAGSRSGWLDIINCFAPMILATALVGGCLAYVSLDPGGLRVATLALAMAATAYGLARTAPEFARSATGGAGGGAQYRVLSANVWRDNPSPELAVEAILARDADAVLLQEWNGSVQQELSRLDARYPYASDCPGSGVRIFVKAPILAQGCGLGVRGWGKYDPVWVQTTSPDGRPVTLVTTHFTWPLPPFGQMAQRMALAGRLSQLASRDLILAGDFNTTPWSFAMKRQDRLFAPLTRRTFARFSWPARLDPLRLPWSLPILPIDHIYAGPDWATTRLATLRIPGSDHFATEATLSRVGESVRR